MNQQNNIEAKKPLPLMGGFFGVRKHLDCAAITRLGRLAK